MGDPAGAQPADASGRRGCPPLFLIRDRDSKFTRDFDEIFRSGGMRDQSAGASTEGARACGALSRNGPPRMLRPLLILGRRHLQHVLAEYVAHYNEHRPHRSLAQRPPLRAGPPDGPIGKVIDLGRVRRQDRLGGLIHEYQLAA